MKGWQSGATGRLSAFGVAALTRMNCLRSHPFQNADTGMCLHPFLTTRRQEGFASFPTFLDSLFLSISVTEKAEKGPFKRQQQLCLPCEEKVPFSPGVGDLMGRCHQRVDAGK